MTTVSGCLNCNPLTSVFMSSKKKNQFKNEPYELV